MMRRIYFLIAAAFAVWSCSESKEFQLEKSDLVIKTGTICGWCSKNDTLIISGKSFRYVNYIQCSATNPSVSKTGQIAPEEVETLSNKLDFQEFEKLDLNSCNVCFDGCDDWITVTKGSETHSIRFAANEPKLQSIKAFVDELNAVKSRYLGTD